MTLYLAEVQQLDRGKLFRIGCCGLPLTAIDAMHKARTICHPFRVEKPGGGHITYTLAQTMSGPVVVQLTPGQDPAFLPHWRSDPERLG